MAMAELKPLVVMAPCSGDPPKRPALACWPPARRPRLASGYEFVSQIAASLNDHHAWSREQIADWLDPPDLDKAPTFPTTL
jgi:hypothetical protein